ncbi:MAG TPA: glucose-1-phosphate adenylyltransferase [Streptosporangiaceae bacterium]|nr:glucose-1-phosphate adenylyltransferase [Streptosporangiaceae bacterium]
MARQRILGVVLAGGAGRRLGPLTADRAKSAVPFGGIYRVVDFTLSNLVNGGLQRICVLTQYKSHSLNRHITTTWRLSSLLDNYVAPVPAQQWLGPRWQAGSADAIYQSLTLIQSDRPGLVLVAGADHVYRMDPNQMIQAHLDWDAGVTVAAIPVPRTAATDFGVIRAAADGHRIAAFQEKPTDPPCLHGSPDEAFASMGTYVFDTAVLVEALRKDAADEDSGHSMGGDIIPRLVRDGAAHVYDFLQNKVPGADARDQGYWREVGTIDSYFEAHMDLCAAHPVFNLYNNRWPILTHVPAEPPAKFVHEDGDRAGRAFNSVISHGVIVSGGLVRESVLSPGARVHSWTRVERSVVLHNTRIGRHAVVRDAILDKNVAVQAGATVGVDKEHDRARGFVVSSGGITVVGKGQVVAP